MVLQLQGNYNGRGLVTAITKSTSLADEHLVIIRFFCCFSLILSMSSGEELALSKVIVVDVMDFDLSLWKLQMKHLETWKKDRCRCIIRCAR